ncbi:holin [Streptomyces sp. NBC_01381]|uniref:holin n=1 Tax=Streptomyces sp. NBC_01381 TaxID=2903845 RepID=UPI002253FD66|nr:holin [Streptomyces sp. NBC_01381]MCX4666395.1 holin [Streptomyces sp. NBC_01381]
MTASVEKKVTSATAGTYLGSTGLLAALEAVQDNSELVSWMPSGLAPFVLALVPAAVTFVSGWATKHSPRGPSSI